MLNKPWFKRIFTRSRIATSIKFSAIIGVSYWATTRYEIAFKSGISGMPILAFLLVALVLLVFGGSLLDSMTKERG
ncbi:MAG: hypothetical protein AABX05_01380 [Nanoarchaeota archaeon]|mgnify:CR=1